MASNNNFKADYDKLRTNKPPYEMLRVMLKDGTLVRPESIDREDLFRGNIEEHFNGRLAYDRVKLEELRDSIIKIGIYEQLSGFFTYDVDAEKVLVITDGHRRLFASVWARQLGHMIAKFPVKPDKLEKGMGKEYYILTQLKTNDGTKEEFTALEKGLKIKEFLAYGHDIDEIVENTGIKKHHLENWLALAKTPSGIKQMIKEGVVAPTTIIDAINTDKTEYRDVLDEALEIAEQEAEAKGKDKVKLTNSHVKQAREKRKAKELTVAEQQELLESVKNTDWDALPPSVLIKVNDLIRKHWSKI